MVSAGAVQRASAPASSAGKVVLATGRRKTAVARVRLSAGTGKITINGRQHTDYFRGLPRQLADVAGPFLATNTMGQYDARMNLDGGGSAGQAGAARHGISRALALVSPEFRLILRKNGFLTRDPRAVERKKPGRPKARKRFQFSKR